jgi:hypothetical protein
MDLPAELRDLIDLQAGLARRGQLLAGGVSPSALRWHLGRRWRLVLPAVVATFTGELSPHQHLVAGQLLAGPEAVLSGPSAAAWHGVLAATTDGVVHLQVPAHLAARRHGFVSVRRTTRPDLAAWVRGPLRVASPARAVVDAARQARSPAQCRGVMIEAVQRRLVRLRDLRHELESGPVRGRALPRLALAEAESGAWSVPEADLVGVLSGSRILPHVVANPLLVTASGERLPTPDAWIDEVGLAIQVHSRRYHAGPQEWDTTVMVDGRLTEQGIVVLAVTPARLSTDPDGVLRRVERTYLALRGRPRPAVFVRAPQPGRLWIPDERTLG